MRPDHAVQFYEDDVFLSDSVSRFLGAGFHRGDAGVVVATEPHRRDLEARLAAEGFNLAKARDEGLYVALDAEETMSRFMVGSRPDERRFQDVIGALVADVRARTLSPNVRIFGEMVALLCAQGNSAGAIRLEELWNDLGKAQPFSLLCAYAIGGFRSEADADPFRQICSAHSHVVPSESYTSVGLDDQLRVIAQLQQKANSLEREVLRRRDAETALRQRESELSEGNRRKDEFLAMLGHELRNPMSPIVTALHLMRLRPDDPELLSRSLEVVDRNFQRVTRLVDDLLDVSRITSGKIELREERVSLALIVERAVEQSRPTFEEKGHRLMLELPAEPIAMRADPTRLEQVLANLMINAAKYTDVGGRISVTVRQEGSEVVIRVQDNGMGMTSELRDRVFDLFVQGPVSPARASGGLGVGLTLVRRLVELHQGTVDAHSDGPGHGSEFVVRLPLRPTPIPPSGIEPRTEIICEPRRILVVDDNADAADGLAEYLRACGHEVRTAAAGPDAIGEASRMRPDVVLLDIGMPDMDGHEVARRLRAEFGSRGCLLVALTGYGQESDRQLSREAGFDHHLVKPIDVRKLDRLLANSR